MRKRTHLSERISACTDYFVESSDDIKTMGSPLYMEIGCGKGKFIIENATLNPDTNFLAVELCENVAVLAVEKAMAHKLSNVKFCMKDIASLDGEIPDGSISLIYLNFSDPWPKKKQAKRRLTHKNFLSLYKRWLTDDGAIFFKTDNQKLFEFSLESFSHEGFVLSNISLDLHSSDFEGNIMTEYETRFALEGKKIYRLEARKQ